MSFHRISFVALLGTASLVTAANAGFTGWQAIVRDAGSGRYMVDVFAGFSTGGDRLLNVYNMAITPSNGATFVQSTDAGATAWRPISPLNSSSLDSFVTIGSSVYAGQAFASANTAGDPNFTNFTTAGATTFPTLAGWYTQDPNSSDNYATDVSQLSGWNVARQGATGNLSVWCAHFLMNGVVPGVTTLNFSGSAAFNTGTNAADTRSFAIPAPGAVALLGVAGLARRRRRD